ncbi:MAG: helix-turn-helix domain-containing protein [Candidatus Iainarchaeum archaeon]|uniref:Helix-turn-helix domain-containing protein n=1 Tax=Candidatus Iainarchaeum sp. TaxID=3101447 RepID=A0A7T9DJM6_9ARCH|nr:MAG: helix-turn-helix domain-containing protein [Candidatus Diapherotrites archaeon]
MDQLKVTIAGEITLSKDPGGSMKKWREIFGISQTELAEYLKVSSSTISDYEGGRRKSPGIAVINRLVEALLDVDKTRGGRIAEQLSREQIPKEKVFQVHEFNASMNGKVFQEKIEGECIANQLKLKDMNLYGYTVIDSLKVILDVPVHEYLQMYGKTPERALIFTQVESGRSPLIAVKVGRFSTDLRPSLVVLHGCQKVDPIAKRIAENEKIPLIVTQKPLDKIMETLKGFEA